MMLRRDGVNTDDLKFFGTDINIAALDCAKRVAEINLNTIEFREDKFADSLNNDYSNSVDVIIFNPPYVVTSPEELADA